MLLGKRINTQNRPLCSKKDLLEHEAVVFEYAKDNNIYWNQHQFDALVSVSFNSGKGGFNKVADKIVAGWDYESAFTWHYTREKAKDRGGVYLGLWCRRMDEYEIFAFGAYEREDRNP